MEHHLKPIGKFHDSYLEDTPNFLRYIKEINQEEKLSNNSMLVVIDVIGLYPNIPPDEGVQSVGEQLKENPDSKVPAGLIMRLLQLILDYSVFEFDQKLYQQLFGTSMGTKPAPSYANVFIARNIDLKIMKILQKSQEHEKIF